jgi:hypothetical protein
MVRHPKPALVYATVPKLLPNGGTVLVLGSGPSLTKADVEFAAPRVDAVIAVNDAYKLAPWATALYAADGHWWTWHEGAKAHTSVRGVRYPAFTGHLKYCLKRTPYPDVLVLKKGPETGLSLDSGTVALGRNSVYQAVNVGIHFGGTRVLLLGVDMQGEHFFGRHPNNTLPPFATCIQRFETMVKPLKAAGVEVINCTRKTALKVFPCVALEDAAGEKRFLDCPNATGHPWRARA